MSEPKKPTKKENEAELKKIRERFAAAVEAESTNRRNYVEDTTLSSTDDQWDPAVKQARGAHRPALTFNRLNGVVKQIIGDYRQNKLSVKVLPASGEASEEIADILAGLIRNIETQSNADMAYTNALECSSRGGFGWFRILTEYSGDDVFDQDLVIRPIHNPLTVYCDPAARLITREDAEWMFVTETISKEQFEKDYPGKKIQGLNLLEDNSRHWSTDKDVRIAEYYEKVRYTARLCAFSNGMVVEVTDDSEIDALAQLGITVVKEREATRTKIVWKKLNGTEVLETKEYKTKYIPIIPVFGEEVNVEGKVLLRSAIYYAKDAQRNFNYWKSTATEAVALSPKAPWLLTAQHIQGLEDQWANANTSPLPYLVYNPDDTGAAPQRTQGAQPPIAEINLALGASDDIKSTTNIYDASLGNRGNETSGKAIVARQQQGATGTYIFIDNLKEAIQHCGRVLIDWTRVTHDTERVIRTLDLEGNPKNVTVNEEKRDPLSGVITILNSLTVGKYDVVVEAGPSFANQKMEMLNSLQQILPNIPLVGQAAPDLIVKALPFHGSNEIAERVKRMLPPQITEDADSPEAQQRMAQAQQQQAQQQQQAMQVQQGEIDAKNAQSQATVVKAQAEIIKAKAGVAQQGMETRETRMETAPSSSQQPQQHGGVHIQFNAEDAMGRIGATMEEFVVHQAEATNQVMQVIQGVLQSNAQSTQLLAESLARQQQLDQQQGAMMQGIGQASALAMQNVATAIENQTAVMAAPRVAVRDKQGNIVASEVRV